MAMLQLHNAIDMLTSFTTELNKLDVLAPMVTDPPCANSTNYINQPLFQPPTTSPIFLSLSGNFKNRKGRG